MFQHVYSTAIFYSMFQHVYSTAIFYSMFQHVYYIARTVDHSTLCSSMYILLRGQVTIYILYAGKPEPEEVPVRQSVARTGESVRTILGTFVCSLGTSAILIT